MLGVHALVAEDAAYLIDTLNAADDEALEVELRCNAQEHVDIKGIVMGNERSCGSTAGDGVENRCLDLHEAASVKERTDIAYKLRAYLEIAAALVAHDEVNVALAVFKLCIGHAVELLGQRTQAL